MILGTNFLLFNACMWKSLPMCELLTTFQLRIETNQRWLMIFLMSVELNNLSDFDGVIRNYGSFFITCNLNN